MRRYYEVTGLYLKNINIIGSEKKYIYFSMAENIFIWIKYIKHTVSAIAIKHDSCLSGDNVLYNNGNKTIDVQPWNTV